MEVTVKKKELVENYSTAVHELEQKLVDYKKVFDTLLFEEQSELILTKIENYLTQSKSELRGVNVQNPQDLMTEVLGVMNSQNDKNLNEKLSNIVDLYLKTGVQANSPGYMGRQFSSVFPIAGVFDFISSMLSQPSSFYEAAQLPSVVRTFMAKELNKFIKYPANEFDMVTTTGGSLANLTALLSARNYYFPEFWKKGILSIKEGEVPAIAVSEEAHYSIIRTVEMLGLSRHNIILLPINDKRQVDVSKVGETLSAAKENGFKVFCIVANAATTAVGAFDPIDKLAEVAEERDCWLHVDGAHGASFLLSQQQKEKLKGINRADSITWDAHKMMFIPGTCSMLFYKDKRKSKLAFRQTASYVFEEEEDEYTKYDGAKKNIECTKRPMIMNLWGVWAFHGVSVFEEKIDYLYNLTQRAYQELNKEDDFEVLHQPEANMLCFRYIPSEENAIQITDFQLKIRDQLKAHGNFFISKVSLDGKIALRVVFMNHNTELNHFKTLLQEIKVIGKTIIQTSSIPNGIIKT
ncbi:L-2,4-diaminobutyrate decarboxylase [Tenacibaculum sp. MAR_2009_124]|uniref:pyridoxal phosphate-dependent decarboxylase family protein n=1 Tax=Tenacibaculum sp. MAR_2009_124 TaxID=1250059 RepID=UPI0008963C09|nr:aminotransferase class V-fold PLP-dependent enzyme [Tenacibaculum sp. MAR_2009_124]SED16825.1 L-2,4-diaminobutyrate decarboxylase [Tenacibaculum sp. MAR_2009_124]